jgi:hypothetical protein
MKSKKQTPKPKQYRVYLAWGKSSDNLLDGMECLLQAGRIKEDRFELAEDEGVAVTAVSRSVDFILVDDPGFTERDIPVGSQEVYLKVVRRRLFGRDLVHAEPLGAPPEGCVLSGPTGRIVWGGADVVRNISPRPIPIRYWIKDTKPDTKGTRRKTGS